MPPVACGARWSAHDVSKGCVWDQVACVARRRKRSSASPLAALPAAWPRTAVAAARRPSPALARCISRPVPLALTVRGALACAVPRPSKSRGLSIGRAVRLTGGLPTALTLAVSILVEAAAWLSQREIRRLPLRGLAFRSWECRANERTMNGAVVVEEMRALRVLSADVSAVSGFSHERFVR